MRLLLLAVMGVFLSFTAYAQEVEVYLLMGQSNMAGWKGKPEDLPEKQRQRDDIIYVQYAERKKKLSFGPLKLGKKGTFGPEMVFGNMLKDAMPRKKLALLKASIGGTNIAHDWSPVYDPSIIEGRKKQAKGWLYKDSISGLKDCLAQLQQKGMRPKIAGILWTQGERDSKNLQHAEAYEKNLTELFKAFRKEFGEKTPIYLTRLSKNQTSISGKKFAKGFEIVRKAQEAVAKKDPLITMIDTDGEAFEVDARDKIHFTGPGMIAMGKAYAEAVLADKKK